VHGCMGLETLNVYQIQNINIPSACPLHDFMIFSGFVDSFIIKFYLLKTHHIRGTLAARYMPMLSSRVYLSLRHKSVFY